MISKSLTFSADSRDTFGVKTWCRMCVSAEIDTGIGEYLGRGRLVADIFGMLEQRISS